MTIRDFQTLRRAILGDLASVQMSRERQDVIDALLKVGKPTSPGELASLMGKARNTMKKLLWEMAQDGQLTSYLGFYTVKIQ